MSYINWFFNNNNASESECLTYIKTKLENKITININQIKNEIKSGKLSNILKNRVKENIISQIINLKDNNNESICTSYTYKTINKTSFTEKNCCLYIIMNKKMYNNLINSNIQQFFADTTYHAIPPTVRKFKLFVISGFNLKDKNTHLCCFVLF